MTKGSLLRITIFYLIGITVSNVFRFDVFHIERVLVVVSIEISMLAYILEGVGLLIGALIAIHLLKKHRATNYSLFGTSKKRSVLMLVVPILLVTIVGVENPENTNMYYYGLLAGVGTSVYCLFEEMGWRGYLQDELISLKEWQRVAIIGFMWYFWHLPFITNQNVLENLQFLGWMVLGSWGIGKVIDSTKSILAASCFHMIINMMLFNSLIKNGLTGNKKLIIIGISVIVWLVIIKQWERGNKTIRRIER